MHILIVFGTIEGQTQKIAETIAGIIRNNGHEVTLISEKHSLKNFSIDEFNAAIIGGSIHMSRYPSIVNKFVSENIDWLKSVPSAFFTVCMGINSKNSESREKARSFGVNFVADSGWQPQLIKTFAGAVKYTQYNFITRFIMKRISRKEGGSTDTSKDHEYTDWGDVQNFAEEFLVKITRM